MHWQNYIGEPYRVFQSWSSDRTTGTEHDNRSPQGERRQRVGCCYWAHSARHMVLNGTDGRRHRTSRLELGQPIVIGSKGGPVEELKKDRPAKFKHSQDCYTANSDLYS